MWKLFCCSLTIWETKIIDGNNVISCYIVLSTGVELTSSSASVSGFVREGLSNNLPFSVSIGSNSLAGTAVGSGLWRVTAFASGNSLGSGTRYGQSDIPLNSFQAGTTLDAGSTATISSLSFPLNLANGPTCSELGYVCAIVEKGDNPSPDFDLTPASRTTCTQVECRGNSTQSPLSLVQICRGKPHPQNRNKKCCGFSLSVNGWQLRSMNIPHVFTEFCVINIRNRNSYNTSSSTKKTSVLPRKILTRL